MFASTLVDSPQRGRMPYMIASRLKDSSPPQAECISVNLCLRHQVSWSSPVSPPPGVTHFGTYIINTFKSANFDANRVLLECIHGTTTAPLLMLIGPLGSCVPWTIDSLGAYFVGITYYFAFQYALKFSNLITRVSFRAPFSCVTIQNNQWNAYSSDTIQRLEYTVWSMFYDMTTR